jgi:KDO2-lipid IV(A) lauroyltransferase
VLATIQEVHGEKLLQDAYASQQGVILAFPHLGNWEIVSLYCSSRYPMTTLYQPPRLMQFDAMIRHGRERLGAKLVATDNTGVRALLAALKQGEMIGVLPDQEPKFGNGVFASFFNIPAYSGTLVSRLVNKTNAMVIFAYAERLPKGEGYQLYFSAAGKAIYADDLQTSVAGLNQGVENCIRSIPEQYQWSYYRFRSRPEGDKPFYK